MYNIVGYLVLDVSRDFCSDVELSDPNKIVLKSEVFERIMVRIIV